MTFLCTTFLGNENLHLYYLSVIFLPLFVKLSKRIGVHITLYAHLRLPLRNWPKISVQIFA